MKKRILSLVVVMMLILSLVGLFACKEMPKAQFSLGEEGDAGTSQTERIMATADQSFTIYAEAGSTWQIASTKVKVINSKTGARQQVTVYAADDTGKYFEVAAPLGGYLQGEFYEITVEEPFKFASYEKANKITFYVPKQNEIKAETKENVILAHASDIANLTERNADGTVEFEYNTAKTGIKPKVNQVILVGGADEYQAHKISSIEFDKGVAKCTASLPGSDEIYKELYLRQLDELNNNVDENNYTNVVSENEGGIKEMQEVVAAATGSKVGVDVKFKLVEQGAKLKIKMTVPNIIEVEAGSFLDLTLYFEVLTQIDLQTDLALGEALKTDKGMEVTADVKNTLTFEASVGEDLAYSESEQVDKIISDILNMLNGESDKDITVKLFTWMIPIGNGVASISYDAQAVMNFNFSGKLGVTSTSSLDFATTVKYDAVAEGDNKISINTTKPIFSVDSVQVELSADLEVRLGLENTITFDLLAGVISLGITAEVGNYNKLFADIATTNLLVEQGISYGYYFEGGLYYDIRVNYNVIKVIKGSKSIKSDEIPLYNAGHKYKVETFDSTDIVVGVNPIELNIMGTQKNLVTKAVEYSRVDSKKFKLAEDAQGYVQIVDGKISLTAKGVEAAEIKNVTIKLTADGITKECRINRIASETVSKGMPGIVTFTAQAGANVEAKYSDGTPVAIDYNGASITLGENVTANEGVIFVYVDGRVELIIYIK